MRPFAAATLLLAFLTACDSSDDPVAVDPCPRHWTAQASLWTAPGLSVPELWPADLPCAVQVRICEPAGAPCRDFTATGAGWREEPSGIVVGPLEADEFSDGHTLDVL